MCDEEIRKAKLEIHQKAKALACSLVAAALFMGVDVTWWVCHFLLDGFSIFLPVLFLFPLLGFCLAARGNYLSYRDAVGLRSTSTR